MAFLSLSFASAALDDAKLYYSYDNSNLSGSNILDTSGNGNTGINNGATTGVTGVIDQAFDFEASTTDYVDTNSNTIIPVSSDFSVCTWINFESVSTQSFIGAQNSGSSGYILYYSGSALTSLSIGGNLLDYTWSPSTSTDYHVCAVHTSSSMELFIDGSSVASNALSGNVVSQSNTYLIGARDNNGAVSLPFDGVIDETVIYHRALSSAEVSQLYNSGNGYNPYNAPPPPPPNTTIFTVTTNDIDSGLAVNNISVNLTFTNATIITKTNTTGNKVFFNLSSEYDELIDLDIESNNYLPLNFTGYNYSSDLLANLTGLPLEDFSLITPNDTLTNQSLYNITWTEAVSPTSKTVTYEINVSYEQNNTLVHTNTTTDLYYQLNVSDYTAENYSVVVSATEQYTNDQFVHNSTLAVDRINYLYFYNEQTTNPIEGANITINYPSATDEILVTNSEGYVEFNSYQSGLLKTGNYTITFEDFIGYVTPITFTDTFNSLPINESYNITVTNINVSLLYRSNFTTFTQNANVIIEGLNNYTTNNGTVFIQNATIAAGTYRITVSSDGFFNEEKTFTFSGQDELDLNIYMLELNSSNSGTVTIRTVDEFSRLLAGTQVNLLEYDTNTLSYIEVSECFTDSNGECKFLVETNTKSYKFTASKGVNGDTVTASTDAQIFEDDISGGEIVLFSEETITLTLNSVQRFTLSPLQNIIYNITPYYDSFNNVTNQSNIDVSFRSIDGQSLTVCVEYFELSGGIKTSLTGNTFCITSSSGEVTENAYFDLNLSKDYVADIYIATNNGDFILDSYRYYNQDSFLQQLTNNAMLPFFVIFIWIFIIGGAIMLKNIPLVGVGFILGSWSLVFFFPTAIIVSVAVLQTIIGINIVYVGRKKEDFN